MHISFLIVCSHFCLQTIAILIYLFGILYYNLDMLLPAVQIPRKKNYTFCLKKLKTIFIFNYYILNLGA